MRRALGRSAAVVAAALGLALSSPPAAIAGAEWLVLPGLALLYGFATSVYRPYLASAVATSLWCVWFSASLRHVTWGGYVGICALALLYGCIPVLWTRALRSRLPASLAFAAGITAFHWLRTHQPEIPYPHAQPCHALHGWPWALGPVRWVGEAGANFLLAGLSAAAVDVYRSWRVAAPPWRGACGIAAALAVAWGFGVVVRPPRAAAPVGGPESVRVLAIEPGFSPAFQHGADARTLFIDHLVRPTAEAAGPGVESPPDLVLWPESGYPFRLIGAEPKLERQVAVVTLAARTRLCAGSLLKAPDGSRAIALLLDARGRPLGWHEKRVPVPAGERLPFIGLLPKAWQQAIHARTVGAVGVALDMEPGRPRPPLETAGGVPFGALMCFDNAFGVVVRDQVDRGARFLAVLSNESWYLQGGELEQMVAMSVVRALESDTPIVRSTVDGVTAAFDRDGRILARLPGRPAGSAPAARKLSVALPLGPGRLPPLAWLQDGAVWLLVILPGVLVLLQLLPSWVRLRSERSRTGGSTASANGSAGRLDGGLDQP